MLTSWLFSRWRVVRLYLVVFLGAGTVAIGAIGALVEAADTSAAAPTPWSAAEAGR